MDAQSTGINFLKEFGDEETICRKLLAKALFKGGDFAELLFEYTVSFFPGIEDGKMNHSYGDISSGVGIRTVKVTRLVMDLHRDLTRFSVSMFREAEPLSPASLQLIAFDGTNKA